jgi:perosamine synthetase
MRYPVARPDLGPREEECVLAALRSGWVSGVGPAVDAFEAQLAAAVGVGQVVAACNGTAALHLALHALGIGPGDEVVVPSLTFVATANAVAYCGATAVFADVDPRTWCLDPRSCARLLGPRTRAIVVVHLFGHVCAMEELEAIARVHGVPIVEDASQALGSARAGRMAGTFGAAATFSFFANKLVTTGEGGAVVTGSAELADRLRLLRGQGMQRDRTYYHPVLGFNYRLGNLAAALGVAQLERLPELVAARRRVVAAYRRELAVLPEVTLQPEDAGTVAWMVAVALPDGATPAAVAAALAAEGIETRPFFHPLHALPPFAGAPNDGGCPQATAASERGLVLPTYSQLGDGDVAAIVAALGRALASQVRAQPRLDIRPVAPTDAADLAGFFAAAAADPEVERFFHPHPLTAEHADELAGGAPSRRDRYFLARWRGRVVGYSMLRGWDEGFEVPSFGCCVHPELRDVGIGGAMLAAAIVESRRLGAPRLRLTVYRTNERAVALYRRMGFVLQAKNDEEDVGILDLEAGSAVAPGRLDRGRLDSWAVG